MVSLLKGMAVQPSRFAVLSLGKDSDSEDESSSWQVAQPKTKGMIKKAVVSSSQHEEGKVLSKNAKKRARKKRNKSTSSDNAVSSKLWCFCVMIYLTTGHTCIQNEGIC